MGVEMRPDSGPSDRAQDPRESGPRVAIVLRTKDRPLLLARALASVLSQRFRDWTLWLVNDGGSRDRLDQALAPFLPQFGDRLRIIHNDVSLGMEAASNRAIEASRSTYLVVHDDDDSWHPDFLAETVAFLDRDENAHYCGLVTWSERVNERIEGQEIHTISREPYNHWYRAIDIQRVLGGSIFAPISFLFRRDIVDRVGGFNEDLPVLGDWDFAVRCLLEADIAVLPKNLAYYHHRVDFVAGDIYGNSIHSGQSTHKRVDAEVRNRLFRAHLAQHPSQLGPSVAISRDFVRLGERLNEVESYLTYQSARVIERLNQVEIHLAHQSQEAVSREYARLGERLNQVEAYLAHQIVQAAEKGREANEQLASLRADLAIVIGAARAVHAALRPVRYLWRQLLRLRRTVARLRGRV